MRSILTILFSIGTSKVPPPDPNIPLTKPVKRPIIEFLILKLKYLFFNLITFF